MIVLLLGCAYLVDLDDTGVVSVARAQLHVSEAAIDFGTVLPGEVASRSVVVKNTGGSPMAVELGLDDSYNGFCVHWSPEGIRCDDGSASRNRGRAKCDTGGGGGGTGGGSDTAGSAGDLCADGEPANREELVLNPGCAVNAVAVFVPAREGAYLGGMRVDTPFVIPSHAPPDPDGDPQEYRQYVRLDGVGGQGVTADATLQWTPRTAAFDWHWPDGTARTTIMELQNTAPEAVTLAAPDLTACPGLVVNGGLVAGTTLAAGESIPVEFSFTASVPAAVRCIVRALTDTGDFGDVVLTVTPPPYSDNPTLVIVSPLPGEAVLSTEALDVQVQVSDDLQPASSLDVAVKAVPGGLISGNPTDDSGYASFTLPVGSLDPGPLVLVVTVTDGLGGAVSRSVPLRADTVAEDDADGDGWRVTEGDCDDSSTTIYPGAIETFDLIDNDCDGTVDDSTEASDDDGDGYSEVGGDCDDAARQTFPGAPEYSDYRDNDCDGVADEGTGLSDGDGDGYAEVDNDCDDANAAINDAAVEVCDGLDNDCDGLKDEADGCVDPVTTTLAYLDLSPDACASGEEVTATLAALLPAGVEVEWSTRERDVVFSGTTSTVTFTCPPAIGATEHTIVATVRDPTGEEFSEIGALRVFPDDSVFPDPAVIGAPLAPTTACEPRGAAAGSGVLGLLLLAATVRRRRAY